MMQHPFTNNINSARKLTPDNYRYYKPQVPSWWQMRGSTGYLCVLLAHEPRKKTDNSQDHRSHKIFSLGHEPCRHSVKQQLSITARGQNTSQDMWQFVRKIISSMHKRHRCVYLVRTILWNKIWRQKHNGIAFFLVCTKANACIQIHIKHVCMNKQLNNGDIFNLNIIKQWIVIFKPNY